MGLSFKVHYLVLVLACIVSSESYRNCAEFKSQAVGYGTNELSVWDGRILGNIPEEYENAAHSWNVSGHWTISTGCELMVCKDVYHTGQCQIFNGSESSNSTSGYWQSASCKCNKQCDCSQVYMQQSVCARAYFHPRGCNFCDTPYTELEGSESIFTEEWAEKVSSFYVRRGCTLEVYSGDDFEEDAEIIGEKFTENWNGTLASYKCQCNENNTEHHPITPTLGGPDSFHSIANLTYPSQLEIPNTLDAVVSQLRENNFNHSGLLASFSSLTHGRSPNTAYILLIGSSGGGKSSIINSLLNNPNVSLVGDRKSITSKIYEYKIPVPVPELGVLNSELRIIDTPGLGDTRGLQNDAVFLATLDEYLSQHPDLKTKIPNLVLVLHDFTDNRFEGDNSKFVKMIQGMDRFRTRITDENYSNVLFVFSHFCSESSKELLRNPAPKLLQFKKVIEEQTLFPKPISTCVIENKGKENELLMVNNNFELPNKEYFPANLLDKFDTITSKGKDEMGRAIIHAAFHIRKEQLNVSKSTFDLVGGSHPKVAKYLSALSSAAFSVEDTEVSKQLAEDYDEMPVSLKSQFPNTLEYLQKYLNVRNIRSHEDLPKTTVEILELLEGMEKNEAVTFLLEKELKITAPTFPQRLVAGYSFNALRDTVLSVSPYKMEALKSSPIGFRLPEAISCYTNKGNSNFLKIFNTTSEYVKDYVREKFGTNTNHINTSIFSGLRGKPKNGFYVKDTSCTGNVCSFVASRYFQLFQFSLNMTATLNPSFIQHVRNLRAFNGSDYQNVKFWNDFYDDYGTHVLKEAFAGGRIDIHVTSPSNQSLESFKENLFKTVEFSEDLRSLISGNKIDPNRVLPTGVSYLLTFHGGSTAYHTSNLAAMSLDVVNKFINNWKKSLKFNPVIYPHSMIPIHSIARNMGLQQSRYIEDATSRLLNSSLTYVPLPSPPPPPPTPDPKLVAEANRIRRENEARLRELEAEKKRKEDQARKLEEEIQKFCPTRKMSESELNRKVAYAISLGPSNRCKRESYHRLKCSYYKSLGQTNPSICEVCRGKANKWDNGDSCAL